MATVLVLAAGPAELDRLRLGNEVKQIRKSLERSRNRDDWQVVSNEAATLDDLRRSLLDLNPTVLHFSGHGAGKGGLAFEDDEGNMQLARSESLQRLLHNFKDRLKCVVLNACYSHEQAVHICKDIESVVGMNNAINDDTAIKFATAFYDAIFAGTTYRIAFDIACAAIDLENLPDVGVPHFHSSVARSSSSYDLDYSPHVPRAEELVFNYVNTKFEDRYKYTTLGKSGRPRMVAFYGEKPSLNIDKASVFDFKHISSNYYLVRALLTRGSHEAAHDYYVEIKDKSMLIEWEATVGYWEIPPRTYRSLGAEKPFIARVHATLGTTKYGPYAEKQHLYQSIDISTANRHSFNGFVRRGQTADELLRTLSDGVAHRLTLRIGNETDDTDSPRIFELLATSWLYLPDSNTKTLIDG